MLITKKVKIKWHSTNIKHYESKGYHFTNYGDEFEVKIEDLSKGSNANVIIECDGCKKKRNIIWCIYLKIVKKDGKCYCKKCATNLFGIDNKRKTNLANSKSFEQWCIDNSKQDVLNRWDYELNNLKPNELCYGVNKKYYFKCSRGLHKSELKSLNKFTSGQGGSMKCNRCNSFAQWGIDNIGSDFLEKYWDYGKNTVNPWEITKSCNKYVYIKCQEKDYHGSYYIECGNFIYGKRCGYCSNQHGKVHPLDSLGTLYPEVLEIWSDKNKKSPYEYSPRSGKEVYWKCPEVKHKDYKRSIDGSNAYSFRCPECGYSKGEEAISEYLVNNNYNKISQEEFDKLIDKDKYNKDYYIPQKEFDGLIGLKNGLLSYDFYLPKYNLLIEFQGQFHDGTAKHQIKEDLKIQQEHDRRKKEYTQKYNINLLEIWYWDFDNIEKILDRELEVFNIG